MIDPLIILIKHIKVVTELFGHIRGFAQDLTGERFYLLNSLWALALFLHGQVVSKFVLVLLSEKVN